MTTLVDDPATASTSDERFRQELRAWLVEHPPPALDMPTTDEEADILRVWHRTLHADGWVGIHWPVEHGGRGASPAQVAIYNQELARAGAPPLLGRAGVTLVGPTLMAHGTEEQCRAWIPRILNGDDVWCQLFSEPGAGSDLASLGTRAERRGDVYVLNGQKVWTSYAQHATWGITLVRTDPSASKTKGISMLAVPLTAPGVTVRPLRQITGASEFNEVFLDDVEVPVANRIGAEHDGWRVTSTTLANERGASFVWKEQVLHDLAIRALIVAARDRGRGDDPVARQRLARSWIDVELFRLHNARTLDHLGRGEELGPGTSLVKLLWAETSQRLYATAVDLLGLGALLGPDDDGAVDGGRWALGLLAAPGTSIMGGTSEIQRTIVGEHLLGLPREPTMTAIDVRDLVDPARHAAHGYPHDTWTRLRAEAPVAWFEPEGLGPFWAITKHADVMAIAKDPVRFSSAKGITLLPAGMVLPPSEMVVMLDPPRHGPMRRVANAAFTPRAVRARRDDIDRIATEILDEAAPPGTSTTLDFVERIAAPFPLAVIAWILGVPSDDWRHLFRWTNEIIGKEDPEYRQPGDTPGQTLRRARGEMHAYFQTLIDERRHEPRDDLVTDLLKGKIDGVPLNDEQLNSYCELLVEAGNETTRNAVSGGLLAFAENRGEWDRLKAQPELLPDAVEEILRWVSPISHFTRVATEDTEVGGQLIQAGEQVALYFASANRDEDVFDDPFTFRIDRRPNPHVAFGFGEHFCMGATVARVELETIFRHLLSRFESFELAGAMERLSSIVNGSIKRLPLTITTNDHEGDTT